MAKQTINIGTAPNDGTGTPLRTAFDYCNLNFTELYTAVGPSGNNIVVPGNATITGDLTVASSILKVTGGNVGINTATPTNTAGYKTLEIVGTGVNTGGMIRMKSSDASVSSYDFVDNNGRGIFAVSNHNLRFGCNDIEQYRIQPLGIFTWYDGAGGTRMTLNSTGLGVGLNPSSYAGRLVVGGTPAATSGAIVYVRDTFANGSNNSLGSIMFASSPGSDFYVGKKVSSGVSWFSIGNANSGAEYFQIDSSGNVGVGVTPSATDSTYYQALEIGRVGQGFTAAKNALTGSPSSWLSNNSYATYSSGVVWNYAISQPAAQYRLFEGQHQWFNAPSGTAGNAITFTQAMTLTANSNLLIGTTTDVSTVKMQVWSPDSNNIVYFRNSNATTPYGPSIRYTAATPNNTGSEFLYCEDSTALRASLRSNGGLANYQANNVSLSDSRLKTDIKPLASYWNKIKSLELVTFKYKDQTHSDDNIGLIAQQVESVAPELVDVDGFGETPADGVPLKTIYTTDLYHASIKALQEAMARIEALEAKLA
jgi:hypothetical protein